jgi:hypothetical protein
MTWPSRPWPRLAFPTTTHGFDLRPIVRAAVKQSGCRGDSLFDLAAFGVAVQERFDLKKIPGPMWCADVLMKLTYVRPISGGVYWQYMGPK